MKHIIEYQPQISKECQTFISNNINFVFSGEDTDIYSLEYVCEELKNQMDKGNEQVIFGLPSKDMEVLQNLINEQVDYIEF
jgi:hypothetical protein